MSRFVRVVTVRAKFLIWNNFSWMGRIMIKNGKYVFIISRADAQKTSSPLSQRFIRFIRSVDPAGALHGSLAADRNRVP